MGSENNADRKWSLDQYEVQSQTFDVDVQATKHALLAQEDTNKDGKITIDDAGPKCFTIQAAKDFAEVQIVGTYHIANLLQELALAEAAGYKSRIVQGARIVENPVDRIRRRIIEEMWDALFRQIDGATIVDVAQDPKDATGNARPRIYVPATAPEQHQYYLDVAERYPEARLDVRLLPEGFYRKPWDLRAENGILALQMQKISSELQPLQYVVPGHRFNECYGWDSYFCGLGLLEIGKVDAARNIARHFIFEIEHYGSVLNANRSYYLGRSHPPFLTDLVLRTYERIKDKEEAKTFLKEGLLAAIKEYQSVWMAHPRFDPVTGLSRYRANQRGIPPEVEEGHYDWMLEGYAKAAGISIAQLSEEYSNGTRQIPELDKFFEHDHSIRESGHDNSYRVEGQCADLATVDLNSLLYKYETDIAWTIKDKFKDHIEIPSGSSPALSHSSYWFDQAAKRKARVNRYLWDDGSGMFHDYNTASGTQTPYKSVTTFWTLWSGLANVEQAKCLVSNILSEFECVGGASSTVEQPFEESGPATRQRQWDYPYGWAPHQIMLWDGLRRYGYEKEAQRLAYRWLYLITRIAVDYNGTITEKYDVTRLYIDHSLDAEYGNQGVDFQGVPTQGFGWTNASYSYGLSVIGEQLVEKLRAGYQWEELERQNTNKL